MIIIDLSKRRFCCNVGAPRAEIYFSLACRFYRHANGMQDLPEKSAKQMIYTFHIFKFNIHPSSE